MGLGIVNVKGFTLIELMIVIAIVSILAMIALPIFTTALNKAKDAQTIANLGALRTALVLYYVMNDGRYPSFPPPYSQPAGYSDLLRDALVPRYIRKIPNAAPSGNHHRSSNRVFHTWTHWGLEDDPSLDAGDGWQYCANPLDAGAFFGTIRVTCTHNNSSGKSWLLY